MREVAGPASAPMGTACCRRQELSGAELPPADGPVSRSSLGLGWCPMRSSHEQQLEHCPLTSQLPGCPFTSLGMVSFDLLGH